MVASVTTRIDQKVFFFYFGKLLAYTVHAQKYKKGLNLKFYFIYYSP